MTQSNHLIPLNDPARRFTSSSTILSSIESLILSGPYLKAKYTDSFEKKFSSYIGTEFCAAVSSGTAALELALRVLELPFGSRVLMAANAGGYAAIAAKRAGLLPEYIDVDKSGLLNIGNLIESSFEASAIIATHLYGQACDMETIMSFAEKHDMRVIEDCAQAAGSVIKNRRVGSFGDISAFSFYPTKNLGGIGDSGAVCTDSIELYGKVKQLREYGWGQKYFSVLEGGGNFRMDEIQALVLVDQLAKLDRRNSQRVIIWKRYADVCEKYGIEILGTNDSGFTAHLAVLRVADRVEFSHAFLDWGIETGIHYPFPDFHQPGILPDANLNLPSTLALCEETISIPIFPEMREDEILRVEDALENYFRDKSEF